MSKKKRKRKLTKAGKIIVSVLLIAAIAIVSIVAYRIYDLSHQESAAEPEPTPTPTPTPTATADPLSEKYNSLYDEYYALNTDYVCYLEFKNQLLYNYTTDYEHDYDHYPGVVVKSHMIEDGEGDVNAANDEYLRYDINHEYLDIGQEFIDGSNVLDENNLPTDQNIIIYGHFVYADHNLKFGPLHTFEDASQYDQYDTFTLTFNHQQRTYQVTDAFFYAKSDFTGIREDSPYSPNYTEEELNAYMDKVKNQYDNTLDTGITITSDDNFVTLQTCVENRNDLLYLVLGKEISRVDFE